MKMMILVVSTVLFVSLSFLFLKKDEKLPEKEELLETVQHDIFLFSQSNREELKKLSMNLKTIYESIRKGNDFSEFVNFYDDVELMKTYLKNKNQFTNKNDKRIIKQNMHELAKKLNEQACLYVGTL
jgi:ribosome-interacting GTPase 1